MSKKQRKSRKKKMDILEEVAKKPETSEDRKKAEKLERIKEYRKSLSKQENERPSDIILKALKKRTDEDQKKDFEENPLEKYANFYDMNPRKLAERIKELGLTVEEYIEINSAYIFEKISLEERQNKWFLEMERKKERIENGEIFENNMTTAEEWKKFAKENPVKAYQEYYGIDDDYLMQIFLKKLKKKNKTITEHMYDRGWPIPNPKVQHNTKNFNNSTER